MKSALSAVLPLLLRVLAAYPGHRQLLNEEEELYYKGRLAPPRTLTESVGAWDLRSPSHTLYAVAAVRRVSLLDPDSVRVLLKFFSEEDPSGRRRGD